MMDQTGVYLHNLPVRKGSSSVQPEPVPKRCGCHLRETATKRLWYYQKGW